MRGILFFITLFSVCSFSLEAQEKTNQTDEEGLRQGYWEQRYPNGNLRYKGHFVDGKPVGELIRYFESGDKMAIMDFDKTGTVARATLFYENGYPAAEGKYVNEKRDSVWKFFSRHQDSLLTAKEMYNMGERDGVSKTFYPGGEVSQTLAYKNGLRHGQWKQFYEGGRLKLEGNYYEDKREGSFKMYNSQGIKEVEGKYEDNLMHGDWKFFNERGDHLYTVEYNRGNPENEDELIKGEQELFRFIEEQQGKIPEPDETERFF